jgi:GNAT superfamily N-acetyltransferase
MEVNRITEKNRNIVNDFIINRWYSLKMIIRGKEIDMTSLDGFYVLNKCTIIGLITYLINEENNVMEITSLDSLKENQGIGTILINRVVEEAKEVRCKKIVLITTNDNINALRFYQKRGFDMVHLFHNALEVSRKLKPEIPFIGQNSIPLMHEIEFEMII